MLAGWEGGSSTCENQSGFTAFCRLGFRLHKDLVFYLHDVFSSGEMP